MAKITLELPDELSEQLAQLGGNPVDWLSQRLPELIALSFQQHALPAHIYHYVLDFLASNPTPAQIADFRPTIAMQERLKTLLSRGATGITPSEEAELDEYERIEHVIVMIKAGNLSYLTQQS